MNNKRNRNRRKIEVAEPIKSPLIEEIYQPPELMTYVDGTQIEIIDDKNFNIIADLPIIEADSSSLCSDLSSPLSNANLSQISIPLPEDDISNYILSLSLIHI